MNPAGITLRELLDLPVLKDAKVISGEKGLNRVVRYIDIMEVPDISGWLREGELLLTTAYSIRHEPALLPKLVKQLAEANAAALAIKPERFLHEMPKAMIQMSNTFDLPIIQLPKGIPYIDITHAVMEQIINKQSSLLRKSEEIYKMLTTLVLENSGIQAVADNVSLLLKLPIWLIDKTGETIVASPSNAHYHSSPNPRYWEIRVDKEMVGKLIVDKEKLDELDQVCIEQARLVFSLELMRRKTAVDTEKRLRGNFVDELLSGLPLSKQEIMSKGSQLGLKPEAIWEVAIIEGEKEEISRHIDKLNHTLAEESQKHHIKSHIHWIGERLVLLLGSPSQEIPTQNPKKDTFNWREKLIPFIQHCSGIRIGFGEKVQLWDVQKSYVEAKKAVIFGMRLDNQKRVFTFEEIEMFHLLMDVSESVEMDKFVEKKIGKLNQYDQENGTDFVKTLYYYIYTRGSLLETAKHLFLHRNSVEYRVDKIRELFDIHTENSQERLVYFFCISYHLFKNNE
ncbi:PucR family transcriptional regulator [Neobacillus ginsengisoli]|uniref:Purine catabolism regulator n=1 Tax=Neobacillus ginsengisoli TaxID=904295 RepID=A0ABT9Y3H5_9BACI|nr:PucR family transcriptional regulator [Neobacillus ginsengisoli]MDQ0201704.1 purine catabolism regulator [Neobacillus ginsengisoli]